MTGATRLRILRLNMTVSTNFTASTFTINISKLNISVSVNFTAKSYNAVVLNPVVNNY